MSYLKSIVKLIQKLTRSDVMCVNLLLPRLPLLVSAATFANHLQLQLPLHQDSNQLRPTAHTQETQPTLLFQHTLSLQRQRQRQRHLLTPQRRNQRRHRHRPIPRLGNRLRQHLPRLATSLFKRHRPINPSTKRLQQPQAAPRTQLNRDKRYHQPQATLPTAALALLRRLTLYLLSHNRRCTVIRRSITRSFPLLPLCLSPKSCWTPNTCSLMSIVCHKEAPVHLSAPKLSLMRLPSAFFSTSWLTQRGVLHCSLQTALSYSCTPLHST